MPFQKNTSIPLGAAIIVKGGSATIEKMFKSIVPVCRQIVVVDTGSVDNSPAICKRYGAELHFLKWTDDFSYARNYCLQFLRTEWILSIDADEIFDFNSFLENLDLFNRKNIGGIKVRILNFLENVENSSYSGHKYTRIFRRNPNIRFVGTIHEQISESIINQGFEIADSEIKIFHYGYINSSKEKINRNKELLEKELDDNRGDAWLTYHLAETEFADGNFEQAKRLFQEIVNIEEMSDSHLEKIKIRLAQLALNEENFQEIEKFTDFTSNDNDIEGLRKFVLAAKSLLTKEFDVAESLYRSSEVNSSHLVPQHDVEKALLVLETIKNQENSLF